MIHRLAIYLLLAGCLVFGAILLSELYSAGADDVKTSEAQARPAAGPPVRGRQNPRIDEQVTTILARPLFSNTRRPPSAPNDAAADADLSGTRLTGIVIEPGHHLAIFAVSGAKPLRVAEGEALNGWRIDSITPREVSLTGPTGAKTLRPTFDANLIPTRGPEAAANAQPVPPKLPAAAKGAPPPVPPAAAAGQTIPHIPPITSPGMPPPRTGRVGLRQ